MTIRSGSVATTIIAAVLLTAAVPVMSQGMRDQRGPYQIEVLVDGQPIPSFRHRGETWVLGQLGLRYTLRIRNRSDRRVEAVTTVDGRDVIAGQPGDWREQRGYLIDAWGEVEIDGWRLSTAEAAAFRFSSVADSYAARIGSAREVGVIGVAVFPERVRPPVPAWIREWRRHVDDAARDQREGQAPEAGATAGAESKDEAAPRADAARGQAKSANASEPRQRSGLGTAFGERVDSAVQEVEFVRASTRPESILGVRYNDREGLLALGIDVDGYWSRGDLSERRDADPFPAERGYAQPPPGWSRER